MRENLSRRFFLDVTADGAIFIRERGQPVTDGALPVFSTDTYEQASGLRVRHCRLARDRSGVYRINDWVGGFDALAEASEMFANSFRQVAYQARVDEVRGRS